MSAWSRSTPALHGPAGCTAFLLILLLVPGCVKTVSKEETAPGPPVAGAADEAEFEVAAVFVELAGKEGAAEDSEAVERLETLGPRAIPAVERRLYLGVGREQMVAFVALKRFNAQRTPGDFSDAQVDRYLELLEDPHVVVRTYAMESLIRGGTRFRSRLLQHQARATPDVQHRLQIVLSEIDQPR